MFPFIYESACVFMPHLDNWFRNSLFSCFIVTSISGIVHARSSESKW